MPIKVETSKIQEINIKQIIPYDKNPRKNNDAVGPVAESIKEFGFKVPIVLDKNNVIIAGHTRFKAAKKLKMKTVPCIVADDLTEEQVKAFRLADNKVGEIAEWDTDLLHMELDDIFDIDMELFGFELIDDEEEGNAEVIEDDYNEEPPAEPKAKLGDIYQLGRHRLMCGDSTSVTDVEKLIDGNKIDLVLTDPPYGIDIVKGNSVGGDSQTHFGCVGGGKIVKTNKYIPIKGDDTTKTAQMNYAIISQRSDNQIIFGGNYFTDFLPPRACWIVWDKENTGNFADVELAWTSFNKAAKLYKWLWNGLCRKGDRSIEGKTRVHPTQKPVGLIGEILKDFSKDNELVLDCFGGSGSTLIACEQLNRKCYMMEFEPHYIDVIIARWEQFTGEKAVLLNGDN